MKPGRRKRIFLILFAAGLITTTLLLFLVERLTLPLPPESLLQQSDVSLSNFRHTATENGKITWILTADRADYDRKGEAVGLINVLVTYITAEDIPISARARSGLLHMTSKDILLKGSVTVEHPEYTLLSEELHYKSENQQLISPVKTEVRGQGLQVKSDAASYDIPKNRIRFQGNVKGMVHDAPPSP
ncbi:LPS export ABC transporter periplasmic protein LptC [Desulfobotulus sp. H1]|uniref:LPS export ABC transporter periplasmic protein LptC n=1 Tax=Desulfobotulus pelophilus TaxID=2823377 RepID=A0ABT3N5U1_9BACT|nr:LPS export ABC transporter periplasmic protein LptC [Desulfobotulus pelophilus]MCW7752827.1 LPS export ABC transporter periplasmic protein LptC [Desulfobotulus pelophilus]